MVDVVACRVRRPFWFCGHAHAFDVVCNGFVASCQHFCKFNVGFVFSVWLYIAHHGGGGADKVLGFERSILLGAFNIILGFFILAFSSSFYFGLSLLLIGTGLFKGNISSLFGMLYVPGDARKSIGYQRFFIFIMLGAILGPLLMGYIAIQYSFSFAFFMAAFFQLCATVPYIFYRKQIVYPSAPATISWSFVKIAIFLSIFLLTLLFVMISFHFANIFNPLMGVISFITVCVFMFIALRSAHEKKIQIIGLTLISLLLVIYYAASFQVNGAMILHIQQSFHFTIGELSIPPTFFASLEALFAFLLMPVMTRCLIKLNQPHFARIILTGLLFASASFILFGAAFYFTSMGFIYLIIANFLLGASVVCIFPTHLSLVSDYAPKESQGTLMGMSFLSDALAGIVSSQLLSHQLNITLHYELIALFLLVTCMIWFLALPIFKRYFAPQHAS